MNKKLFLIPLMAAAMAACTNDNVVDDPNNGGTTGETETRYLAVNIMDTSIATRAYDNQNEDEDDYENGSDAENEVKSIRFFLFNSDGTKFTTKPYADATAEPIEGDNPNIEKKLQAVIVFEAEKSDAANAKPMQIVAVLNPPTDFPIEFDKVTDLQEKVENYLITGSGKFIMSNSVYAVAGDPNATEHIAYDVIKTYDSKAAALAAPVNIYVERVVAKTRVGIADTFEPEDEIGNNIYDITGQPDEGTEIFPSNQGQATNKKIYVKLLGWNVTGTAKESRLVKKINPAWGGTNWLGDKFAWGQKNEWNYPTFNRSFWAINPSSVNSKDVLNFGAFGDVTEEAETQDTKSAMYCDKFDGETPIYIQENASWDNTNTLSGSNPTYPTKLIIAAQLVDETGNGVDLGWYGGSYYMQQDLKQVVLNNANIFKKTTGTSNEDIYTPVNTTDVSIKFITTTEAGDFKANGERNEGVKETVNRYNCYAQTDDKFSWIANTYYVKKSDGTYEAIEDAKALNTLLKTITGLKVWTSGYTYYWKDITHLAPHVDGEGALYGEFGIVRNHIYDYTISSIKGFGIPVLDPSETIYPEDPNDPEMMYLAAKINILSWRLVNHDDTQLGW